MIREGSAADKVVATFPNAAASATSTDKAQSVETDAKPAEDDWHGQMKQTLKSLDKEGTGFVSVEHIRQAVGDSPKKNVGESKLNSILSEVAVNGDGKVDYEDFLGLFKMGLTV